MGVGVQSISQSFQRIGHLSWFRVCCLFELEAVAFNRRDMYVAGGQPINEPNDADTNLL